MNYKEFTQKYSEQDFEDMVEMLWDYVDSIVTEEPYAVISIREIKDCLTILTYPKGE